MAGNGSDASSPPHTTPGNGHKMMYTDVALNAQKLGHKGAVYGAAKWGLVAGLLGGMAYVRSPVYRFLTIQVKFGIQLTIMMFGAWVEAERVMVRHTHEIAAQRRLAKERAVWSQLEREAEEFGLSPPPRPKHLE